MRWNGTNAAALQSESLLDELTKLYNAAGSWSGGNHFKLAERTRQRLRWFSSTSMAEADQRYVDILRGSGAGRSAELLNSLCVNRISSPASAVTSLCCFSRQHEKPSGSVCASSSMRERSVGRRYAIFSVGVVMEAG